MNILLVEDNPGDARLTQEALKESSVKSTVKHVVDGIEAMSYLKDTDAALPDLVLLDLNMPKKDGKEVLQCMSNTPAFNRIPVVVLTTSSSPEDINACFDLHANCYVTKPVEFEQYMDTVKSIHDFWLNTSKHPVH